MTKPALSRSAYVDAALDIIAELGVDKLSMRKVATQLGVSPMAMYKHFSAKDDLLAAAFDAFIARADVIPSDDLPWEQWVEQAGRGMYLALCAEMSWVPLLGSLPMGKQAATVTDAFVKKLQLAGFKLDQAVEAYYAVIQIAVGAVCLRASLGIADIRTPDAGELSSLTQNYLENADAARLTIAPVQEALLKRDQIDIALPLLIEALRARLKRQS